MKIDIAVALMFGILASVIVFSLTFAKAEKRDLRSVANAGIAGMAAFFPAAAGMLYLMGDPT